MKKILDSVHGYIEIPREYFKGIIDTEYFQRLRRIEQTSTRSIFPSARHDRFIHSLGVYYLGSKIATQIETEVSKFDKDDQLSEATKVLESYKLACLLHDISHSPFSHTFESYFSNRNINLKGILCKLVDKKSFEEDWNAVADPSAPHEIMSAIVSYGVFGAFIDDREADKELVARMIIGLEYSDKIHHSFRNVMISLIHGDVIDADGLDYVCRDTWASGYSTNKVDVNRLINSIKIVKDRHNIYQLCYTTKCLNEIEAVLKVKTFQQHYVINHHTVAYEQKLLIESMKSAAVYHMEGLRNVKDPKIRRHALEDICDIKCFYNPEGNDPGIYTKSTNIHLRLPMDDDYVVLMKHVLDDKYASQWFSRKYTLKPLWKSKADFYQNFDFLRNVHLIKDSWIFHNDCKKYISKTFGIDEEDIWIVKATPKYKGNYAKKVKMFVNNDIITYFELFPLDVNSYEPSNNEFCYIYVPNEMDSSNVLSQLKAEAKKYFMNRE